MAQFDLSLHITINCPDCKEGILVFKLVENGYGILGECSHCSSVYFGGFHMLKKQQDTEE